MEPLPGIDVPETSSRWAEADKAVFDELVGEVAFALRSYLALLKYAEVIELVLPKKPASQDAPRRTVFFPVTGARLLKKNHRVGDIFFFAGPQAARPPSS